MALIHHASLEDDNPGSFLHKESFCDHLTGNDPRKNEKSHKADKRTHPGEYNKSEIPPCFSKSSMNFT